MEFMLYSYSCSYRMETLRKYDQISTTDYAILSMFILNLSKSGNLNNMKRLLYSEKYSRKKVQRIHWRIQGERQGQAPSLPGSIVFVFMQFSTEISESILLKPLSGKSESNSKVKMLLERYSKFSLSPDHPRNCQVSVHCSTGRRPALNLLSLLVVCLDPLSCPY